MTIDKEAVTLGTVFGFIDELLLLLESINKSLQESEENEQRLMAVNMDLMEQNIELTEYNDRLTKLIKESTKIVQ